MPVRRLPILLVPALVLIALPSMASRKGWHGAKTPTPAPSPVPTPDAAAIPDPPFVETRPAVARAPSPEAQVFLAYKPVLASVTAQRSGERGGNSQGSAFVIHASGLLLTNFHVVSESDDIRVRFADGLPLPARLAGADPALDLAVLRIDPPANLGTVILGDSDAAHEGDPIVALGMPFGLGTTITRGILSGKERRVDVGTVGAAGSPIAFLQTDAAINPGSSGGPIVDMDGRVVGITTATIPAAKGISFAIPINAVKTALPRMLREASIGHAWLGLTLGPANGSGAEVIGVRHKGPADRAGLMTGDIVTAVRGRPISADSDVVEAVRDITVHETVSLSFLRRGKVTKVDLTATEVPVAPVLDSLILGGALLSEFSPDMPQNIRVGRRLEGSGVFFDNVPKGSGADRAGIQDGDVLAIVGMDNVSDLDDVRVLLDRADDAGAFKILVRRGEKQFTAIVPR